MRMYYIFIVMYLLDNSYTHYTDIIGWKFKITIKPGNDFEEQAEESDIYS